jgi:hydroxyethylthiazole kinase-like sugar kinase family protein
VSIFRMPEGVELDIKIYLVGLVQNEEAEIVLTVGGLPAFSDSVNETLELPRIIEAHDLNAFGTDWRVMTRAEIADYRKREKAERGGELHYDR